MHYSPADSASAPITAAAKNLPNIARAIRNVPRISPRAPDIMDIPDRSARQLNDRAFRGPAAARVADQQIRASSSCARRSSCRNLEYHLPLPHEWTAECRKRAELNPSMMIQADYRMPGDRMSLR
jgi:hypothetical protein